MAAGGYTDPVVDDLIRALGERTGCAGLISADSGRLLSWSGDAQAARTVARCASLRRVPEEGHPAIVRLLDGPGVPAGVRFIAAQPLGPPERTRLVVFAAATSRGTVYEGIPVLMRSIAAALRRQLAQLTPAGTAGARAERRAVGVMIADASSRDTPLTWVSRDFCRMTGYGAGEVIGRNPRFLQGGERDQPARWRIGGAIARGESCVASLRNYRRDGRRFDARLELTPVRGLNDRVTHFIGVLADVSARARRGLPRLPADSAQFLYTLEMSPVGKIVVDASTGRARYANPVAARMFERRTNDLVGREMGLLPMTDGPVRLPGAGASAEASGRLAEMTVKSIHWGRHPALLVTLFDVIERPGRLDADVPIDQALDRYPYPVVCSRPDGSLAWVSQGAADLLGRSRDELMDLDTGHIDAGGLVDGEAWARNWQFVRLQQTVTIETRLQRRDGWTLPAVLDVQHVERNGGETHVVFIRNASGS